METNKIYIFDIDEAFVRAFTLTCFFGDEINEVSILCSKDETDEILKVGLNEDERLLICEEKKEIVEKLNKEVLERNSKKIFILERGLLNGQKTVVQEKKKKVSAENEILLLKKIDKYSGLKNIKEKLDYSPDFDKNQEVNFQIISGISERGGAGLTTILVELAKELSTYRKKKVFFIPMTDIFSSKIKNQKDDLNDVEKIKNKTETIFNFIFSYFIDSNKTYESIKKYVKELNENNYSFEMGKDKKNYLLELNKNELLGLILVLGIIFKIDYFIFDYGTRLTSFENRIKKNGETVIDMQEIGKVDFEKGIVIKEMELNEQ